MLTKVNTQSNNTYEHLTFNGGRSSLFTISNTLHVSSDKTVPFDPQQYENACDCWVSKVRREEKKSKKQNCCVDSQNVPFLIRKNNFKFYIRESFQAVSTCPSVKSWLEET